MDTKSFVKGIVGVISRKHTICRLSCPIQNSTLALNLGRIKITFYLLSYRNVCNCGASDFLFKRTVKEKLKGV